MKQRMLLLLSLLFLLVLFSGCTPGLRQIVAHEIRDELNLEKPISSQNTIGTESNAALIDETEAKQAAFQAANVAESEITALRIELDRDDGRTKYEIDFHVGYTEYEYDIDAITGEILSHSAEHRD